LHQGLHRFAHRYGIVVHRVTPEQPVSAVVSRRPHCPWRILANVERIQLRLPGFSVILTREHCDVLRLLLADPASLALVASLPFLLLRTIHCSILTFSRIRHGRNDTVRQIGSAGHPLR
jgi:hypothetical protein